MYAGYLFNMPSVKLMYLHLQLIVDGAYERYIVPGPSRDRDLGKLIYA